MYVGSVCASIQRMCVRIIIQYVTFVEDHFWVDCQILPDHLKCQLL